MKKWIVAVSFALLMTLSACGLFERDDERIQIDLTSELEEAELSVSPERSVEKGTEVTITASEVDGYTFKHWHDGEEVLSEENPYTFTPEASMTIAAVYDEDDPDTEVFSVTLTSTIDEAELTLTPSDVVEPGTEVNITASEVDGWQFLHWEQDGDIVSEERNYSFFVEADTEMHAVYEELTDDMLSLTVSSNIDEGSFSVTPKRDFYATDANVSLLAEDVSGYRFEYWRDVDLDLPVTQNKTYAMPMHRDRNIEAVYIEEDLYEFYLTSNAEGATLERTVDGPYESGETITLSTSADEPYRFAYWYDYYRETVLSEKESFEIEADRSRHIVAVYEKVGDAAIEYETGFEDTDKTSYARGTLITAGEPWIFDDALVGNLDGDLKVNNWSVRIQDGYIETDFAVPFVEEISFLYGTYGSDGDSDITVEVSPDQESWYAFEETLSTTDSLQEATFTLGEAFYENHDMPFSSSLHVRIGAPGGNRVNVDEFEIVSRAITIPELPQDALVGDVMFPDNSERLELTLSENLGYYYSYGDTWENHGCEAFDTVSEEMVDCMVYGEVDTERLGEYELTYYAIDAEGFYRSETVTKVVLRDATLLDYDYSDDFGGYYEGIGGLYGDDLAEALHEILRDTVSYNSYGDARYILQETDQDPENPDNVILIYTRDSVPGEWDQGQTWNREHVWPSRRFPGDRESNLGSDLHNLTPADPGENSSRGYKYFTDETTAQTYAPPNEAKGFVARMMFYMDVMYEELSLVSGYADADNYEMGDMDYLMPWHFAYAADDFEENRNEIISQEQGNRNPFIDYPHLVELLYYDHDALPLDD